MLGHRVHSAHGPRLCHTIRKANVDLDIGRIDLICYNRHGRDAAIRIARVYEIRICEADWPVIAFRRGTACNSVGLW